MSYRQHTITCNDPIFWAWFAGFMDGDGCITWDKYGPHAANPRPLISFTQKVREPLDYLVENLGTGSVFRGKFGYYYLRFGSDVSRQMCERLVPLLRCTDKIEKAKKAVAWQPKPFRERSNVPENKENFKRVLDLRARGFTYFEIAKVLDISMETARRWVKRSSESPDAAAQRPARDVR